MRALITGGKGFVGGHLAKHLIEQGDEVVIIDVEHDVADATVMSDVIGDVLPDVVYHLAAISHVGLSWDDPTAVLRVNVLGTAVLLAALRRHQPAATTLLISSAEVYGTVEPGELPLTEGSPARPSSPYAASKLAAEVVALQAVRGFGQSVVVARAFNHIGPGQSPTFFVPAIATRLIDARRAGQRTMLVGNLSTSRDFTDVRDVVRAYRLLVERGVSGEVYNVASGVDRTMLEIADSLRRAVDESIVFETDPALLRPSDIPVLRGSYEKLHAATSWEPEIEFATTLADILDSVQEASVST
jgi:GDP-4-dehydro-6-deoxy-D-mannose reductase